MGDPVSLVAGCLAFSLASLKATKLLFQLIDGIRNVDEEMECFRAEIWALSTALEAIRDSFADTDDMAIHKHGSQAIYHFQTVLRVMKDCQQCLERLNDCLPAVLAPKKTIRQQISFTNLKKKVLLDFKSERIMILRRQLQSYRDVLSIHISLINLGGRQRIPPSTEATAKYILVKDMKSTKKRLARRIESSRVRSVGGVQDQIEDAYLNIDNCLQSVKSIISDGSSISINNTVEGSFSGFSLSLEKRKDVEKWLSPDKRPPALEPYRSESLSIEFELGESFWEDHSQHSTETADSVISSQTLDYNPFRRLGTLRGTSPMSRISEESRTTSPRLSLPSQLSDRNPYRNAPIADVRPVTRPRKSRSERTSVSPPRGRDLYNLPFRAASHNSRRTDYSDYFTFGPDHVRDSRDAPPTHHTSFSVATTLDQPSIVRPQARKTRTTLQDEQRYSPSHSMPRSDNLGHSDSVHPAARRRIDSLPDDRLELIARDTDAGKIPSFKRQDPSPKIGSPIELPAGGLPPPQTSLPSPLPKSSPLLLSDTVELSMREYEVHKQSGSIQMVPSSKFGAKRSEKALVRMLEHFGSSPPRHIEVEIYKLLVVMHRKQSNFQAAERVLTRLQFLVPTDEQPQINIEKMYVEAVIALRQSRDKEAEGLVRRVANYELSLKREDNSTSQVFKDSVMLLIDLALREGELGDVRAYEGLLPDTYRRLQNFKDFCDQVDELLDEGEFRKLNEMLSDKLPRFILNHSVVELGSIQMQICSARSVFRGGKGIASQALPIYSLAHVLAEENRAPELEVLYRCTDATPDQPQHFDQQKNFMYLQDDCPLIAACATGAFEAADILIKKGSDINAQNSRGETALQKSIRNRHTKLANHLVNLGAQMFAQDRTGGSAHTAAALRLDPDDLRNLDSTNVRQQSASVELASQFSRVELHANEEPLPQTSTSNERPPLQRIFPVPSIFSIHGTIHELPGDIPPVSEQHLSE
ncbi:MAG: hypothetical protein M1814_006326 [Vezdaea aestivalis]|nr:MAG: hypothetical protein M1814_006326 [Vezdaea aestivalis]